MWPVLLVLALAFSPAHANTEKVIFMGPSTRPVPVDSPTLEDLRLPELSPHHWALRTHLAAAFPTDTARYGQASWVLLHRLQEGQRYEVRICWAATVCDTLSSAVLIAGSNYTSNQLTSASIPTSYPRSSRTQS
jgi:hypothetical protein